MPQKNTGNAKSDQSKEWMEATLLKLMETQSYAEITIQQLTDLAGLSRRTFYRNYSSKDEIIEGLFLRIWREYEALIRREDDLSMPNIARILFTVMSEHVDFLLLANRHQLLPFLLSKVDQLLPVAFEEVKGFKLPYNKDVITYALTFSTGGFSRILIRWLCESPRKTPDQMATVLSSIIAIANYPLNA